MAVKTMTSGPFEHHDLFTTCALLAGLLLSLPATASTHAIDAGALAQMSFEELMDVEVASVAGIAQLDHRSKKQKLFNHRLRRLRAGAI